MLLIYLNINEVYVIDFTWWNDDVAKAIEEKRRCYKIWHKTKTASDRNKFKEARQNARRGVALAQEKTRQELVNELESTAGKKNVYRVAKQWQNPGRM